MSRIGKKPIKLLAGSKVVFRAPNVEVSGKLGKLTRKVPESMSVDVKGDEAFVVNVAGDSQFSSIHGLTRTLIKNMVQGVTEGYSKELELQGVGYRASVQGSKLVLQVGFSHIVNFDLPPGISGAVDANTKITIKGTDKELVGIIAAKLRKIRPPEPYKGKGIRYVGETIQLKQGKTAGGAK